VAELSDDVQSLSHDLHSSNWNIWCRCGHEKLCKRVGERQRMEIDSKVKCKVFCDPKSDFPCSEFCRKRSTTRSSTAGQRVEVELREESGEVHLLISDLGKGSISKLPCKGKV